MRRILVAMLVSLTAAATPSASLAGAQQAALPPKTVALDVANIVTPTPPVRLHRVRPRVRRSVRRRPAVVAPQILAHSAAALHVSIARLREEWQHVAICEVSGNWSMVGSAYSGIGFLNATWSAYGGTHFARLAGLASRDQQILIGMKVTGGRVPDQNGCSPTGW